MQRFNLSLFLIGLFAETQIRLIGSIGISELYMFVVAPFVFLADFYQLKRNGFMPFLFCALLSMVGCIISSIANHTPTPLFLRGFASVYSLFAIPVVFHRHLSRDLDGFKWLLLGYAFSGLLTMFAFTPSVEMAFIERAAGDATATELFFARHFGALIAVWYKGWYMQCPTWLAVLLMLIPVVQQVVYTSTGRSFLFVTLISILMILYVDKKIDRMRRFEKRIIVFIVLFAICGAAVTSAYKYAAIKGYLNDQMQQKYLRQTKHGTGVKDLLMGGRSEFFAGLSACLDRPIIGFGPWAVDEGNYWEKFILWHGDSDDFQKFQDAKGSRNMNGVNGMLIPSHSHIVGFWLWYGILGLPIWIYSLKKAFEYLCKYTHVMPQWFAWVACAVPDWLWGIFFSPFSARMSFGLFMTAILLVIAVGKGHLRLHNNMYVQFMKPTVRRV